MTIYLTHPRKTSVLRRRRELRTNDTLTGHAYDRLVAKQMVNAIKNSAEEDRAETYVPAEGAVDVTTYGASEEEYIPQGGIVRETVYEEIDPDYTYIPSQGRVPIQTYDTNAENLKLNKTRVKAMVHQEGATDDDNKNLKALDRQSETETYVAASEAVDGDEYINAGGVVPETLYEPNDREETYVASEGKLQTTLYDTKRATKTKLPSPDNAAEYTAAEGVIPETLYDTIESDETYMTAEGKVRETLYDTNAADNSSPDYVVVPADIRRPVRETEL